MNRLQKPFAAALALLLASSPCWADAPAPASPEAAPAKEKAKKEEEDLLTWEWTGNSQTSYLHFNQGGTNSHQWAFDIGLNFFITNWIEIGVTSNYIDVVGNGDSAQTFQFLLGPTFNFWGRNPDNSFFLTIQAGVELFGNGQNTPNATTFSYLVGAGRRFGLIEHIAWAPEVAVTGNLQKTTPSGYVQPYQTNYEVIPFQFSLTF